MENRIYGIVLIGVIILLYILAYSSYKRSQYKSCLYIIILSGLILRIYTSMDFYLHPWDERYHALVAKNLLKDPFKPLLYSVPLLDFDYKSWVSNHVWLHKQPFPLYSMAISMYFFGTNVIALRLPSILLSTLSIFATFKIGKILDSTKVGLIAAFLFSINGLIIEQTAGRIATDHIDVFFFSLVTIAVYLLLRSITQKSILSFIFGSILTGLAVLSKWLPALIVIPIWLTYSLNRTDSQTIIKKLVLILSIILLIVLPWQIYILNNFPMEAVWEYAYNKRHIFESLDQYNKPFYFHFDKMRIIFGEIIYIPFIWLLITTYKQIRTNDYTSAIISTWILIPYIFFSFAATKLPGYILICAAPIFVMTSMFFVKLEATETKYVKLKKLILALLIILPLRYSIERVKPFSTQERNHAWISDMKMLESTLDGKPAVIFNCQYPIETMFHTEMIAYETTPSLSKLMAIESKGYSIYIDNNEKLKGELKQLDFVNYVSITGKKNDFLK